eukprot:gnl/TRDRNA2_/TRDRNA2_173600_c6_seq5.p1 gnl/TRDRNA2_/TRDRNA2_173600_c6~~gnl/TRDRNA2_/TRDRNA2_173600_c6_seq5.p1  ORF type:complete len:314 (+),score=52.46 gnl/TRDRNA2_/TRDRNA2_173600_c6_seq5:54-944(+)
MVSPQSTAVPESNSSILEAIAQKLGDGKHVCILGGVKFQGSQSEEVVVAVAKALSSALAKSCNFVTGGMPGVQETFAKNCISGSRVYNLLPVGDASNYGIGEDIPAGATLPDRMEIFGQLGHLYVTFEGGPGVAKEARAAVARGATVIPLMRTGGASGGMFEFPAAALSKPSFATEQQWEALRDSTRPVADSARAVVEIVKGFVTQRDAPSSGSTGAPTESWPLGAPFDRIAAIFQQWDSDGNGKISKAELSRVMMKLNPKYTQQEIDVMFNAADSNQDGWMDYREFTRWLATDGY